MTGRERILAALRGEPADRTPVMLHNFLMAARENGLTMARFRRDGRAVAASFIRAVETYSTDGILVDVSTAMLAGALGVPVDLPEDLPARCKGPLIASLEAVPDLQPPDIAGYFEIETALESVRILKAHFGDAVAVRGNADQAPFSLAAMVRGLDAWMMDLVEADPERIRTLLDYCFEATRQFLDLMAEAGADILSNGDSPAGPDLISPAAYRRFAQPWEKACADRAHSLGKPYVLHICGNTGPILADMIATGADGLELDYKTDPRQARAALRGRACLIGNIDPSGVLALGTPAEVEDRTRELLEIFRGEPRFILNAGCAIPAETPAANLRAMLDTRGD
ncbi:MAG: uroporphyrinogen decarboxylase family protein [Candidatus Aminicenantes bacterium]|nr:uroporphyrinogen decarboxylase family protein [Candidatus Aminicenantes bacterium]